MGSFNIAAPLATKAKIQFSNIEQIVLCHFSVRNTTIDIQKYKATRIHLDLSTKEKQLPAQHTHQPDEKWFL